MSSQTVFVTHFFSFFILHYVCEPVHFKLNINLKSIYVIY